MRGYKVRRDFAASIAKGLGAGVAVDATVGEGIGVAAEVVGVGEQTVIGLVMADGVMVGGGNDEVAEGLGVIIEVDAGVAVADFFEWHFSQVWGAFNFGSRVVAGT